MPSANKHMVQICRFSLSAAADGLAHGSGERRTSPFNGDAQSWNGIERSLTRAVVPQFLPLSVSTFPTVLSLYIAQGRLQKNIRYPSCGTAVVIWTGKVHHLVCSCLKHANEMLLGDTRQADQRTQTYTSRSSFSIRPPLKRQAACLYMLLWISPLQLRFLAPTSALKHLSWSTRDAADHKVYTSCAQRVRMIRRLRWRFSPAVLKKTFIGAVQPKLAWSMHVLCGAEGPPRNCKSYALAFFDEMERPYSPYKKVWSSNSHNVLQDSLTQCTTLPNFSSPSIVFELWLYLQKVVP